MKSSSFNYIRNAPACNGYSFRRVTASAAVITSLAPEP